MMEHTKRWEELNNEALEKIDKYVKSKGAAVDEHHEKISTAKEKWQQAWNEFLETLVVLEKLEI
ncbi:MAG: hypothetical protein H7320_20820 [Ferruginibacter sp.]|nr:hypothetical protein [Ferruginibacter sp.]